MQVVSAAFKAALDAHNPQRVLLVFSNREFSNEDISLSKGISLNEEFNPEEELTIGLATSSVISFSLLNDVQQLSSFSFGWFTAYIGVRIDSGTPTETTRNFTENGRTVTYAFAPIGVFYAEKPKIMAKSKIDVTAYDQMILFDIDMPDSTTLGITYPTTMSNVFKKMCDFVGVTPKSLTFLNYDLDVPAEYVDFAQATMRQVLMWIAEAACGNIRFDREGKIEVAWYNTTDKVYTESNYKDFIPAWYETEAIDGLYCRDNYLDIEDSYGTTKTNNYLIQDNPFLCEYVSQEGG